MRIATALCILTLFILAPTMGWAAHPFQVEDTDVQGKGNYLFELNGDYTKVKNTGNTITDLRGVFHAGSGDDTDVVLDVPYFLLDQSPVTDRFEKGVGDVLLKIKYRTNENEVHQSSGFQIYAGLPTGRVDKGFGTNNTLLGLQMMDQQGCCDTIYRVSFAYEVVGEDVKTQHWAENYAFRYGISLEHKITESFHFLSELFGENRKTKDTRAKTQSYTQPYTFMAGFEYDISKSWYVDLEGRAGLSKDAEDYTGLAGTAWKF